MAQELNENEKYLLQQVDSGEPAIFDVETHIDTRFLREHILELVPGAHAHDGQRSCLRWVIHNAVFTKQLDLSDGRRSGGGSLPAIEFHACDFQGGFCADGAHIDRLFFNHCRFTSDEPKRNYISVRNCRISTELRLENLKPADKPEARNLLWVDAFASFIGTNVVVKHSLFRAPEGESSASLPEARYALDLATAEIQCDLQLQPSVVLEGGLKMRDSRIGGSVWGQGLHVTDGESEASRRAIVSRGESCRYGIRARSATIHGNFTLSVDLNRLLEELGPDPIRFCCQGSLELMGIQVSGDLDLTGAYIEGKPEAHVFLDGATIRGGIMAPMVTPRAVVQRRYRAGHLVFEIDQGQLLMNSCHVSGDCKLNLKAAQIWADGLSVDSNLQITGNCQGLTARGLVVSRDTDLSLKSITKCKLGGSTLRGNLDLRHMHFAKGSLSLHDAEIGRSLVIAPLYSRIEGIRRRQLTCYPGFMLTEVMLPEDPEVETPEKIASFLNKGKQTVVLLDGKAEQFHELNTKLGLKLQTEQAAQEYLRLFCAYTWDDEGSFTLVEDDAHLPAKFRRKVTLHPVRPVKDKEQRPGQEYFFEAFVRYGNFLFYSVFRLEATGMPTMLSDEPVVANGESVVYEPSEAQEYQPPFRFAHISQRPDFESSAPAATGPDAIREFKKEVPDWSERLVRDRLADVEVDLRAASCGTLNDNAARAWEHIESVNLEEFDYEGTVIPDNVSVQSEMEFRLLWLRGLGKQSWRQRWIAALRRFCRIFGVHQVFRWVYRNHAGWWMEKEPEFRAQPYAHLAKVLRERGDDEAARDVEAEKIRWGAYDRARRSWGGRLLQIVWWWPYGFFYRFGLAPGRALLTLAAFWFIGFLAITMLSENGLLKANISTVAAAALPGPEGPTAVIPTPSTNVYTKKFPCGEAVAPALYAAELLIPVLNLHQESRCDVRSPLPEDQNTETLTLWHRPIPHFHWMVLPRPWEYLKAAYILFGSIITSLALLTFSGIARRWEH